MNPAVLSFNTSLIVTFLASFLIWIMYAGIAYLWIVDGNVKKEVALHALFASFLAWGITQMIKELFPTIRPFYLNNEVPLTITIPLDGAFPSGHAASAFALALSVWQHNKKYGATFVVLAILVGMGRVLSNVHFVLDIAGGAVVGLIMAYALGRLHLFGLIGNNKSRKR